MLTKEFAQRVELSEKQVRKIVQHLEERGYQLSKTEYRGREATDFKEEDIELFKDIADKVKQTNSYDLAFDELEKEKDFLQVIVKNDDKNLPTNQNVAQLVEDLRLEIQKMREERHLLGQMMNQVHQQQQELKELQNQLTSKIDSNSESLKAIQTSQEAIQEAQASQAKVLAESTNKVEKNAVTEDKADSKDSKVAGVTTSTDAKTDTKADNAGDGTTTKVDKEDQISATEAIEKASVEQSNGNAAETSNKEATVDAEAQHDAEQQVAEAHAEASKQATSNDSLEAKAENDSTASQSEMSEPKPQEEKKGFFARLFNL
ncbi:hypothetical protein R6N47_08970 [Staphylococcus aureus]|uniref:DNA-binding protein n=1 Tax=Staphylococcus aureus TaxID=1280 RepID=A0AB74PYJ4_STAAU|nr:hypothetical protein [Staphylococcus aureus]AMV81513.1 hypothetical protein SAST42_00321 [Staphylococcus aureus]AMV84157.1 hypothetical protein SAST43_00279 [Staphylococcus aureus]EGG68935.1 hypothetical protein SA21193_1829 [Staphylococcus aureus subsp. aureus 21193]EGL89140.1 hypothetical protein SA21305_1139 [Staphylococcus aureus subsp. aureus 21305]EIB2244291.1 hypothetical protein [Staphylococcus aureus]